MTRDPLGARELSKLVELIAYLGTTNEVELQAKTLKPLGALQAGIELLIHQGIVKRREGFFQAGYGDALELTRRGYKAIRPCVAT
jgi:hypothetical protein